MGSRRDKLNVKLYGSLDYWHKDLKETASAIAQNALKHPLDPKIFSANERQQIANMTKKLLINKVIDMDVVK